MVVLGNMSNVFSLPLSRGISGGGCQFGAGFRNVVERQPVERPPGAATNWINGGVILFKPDQKIYLDLSAIAASSLVLLLLLLLFALSHASITHAVMIWKSLLTRPPLLEQDIANMYFARNVGQSHVVFVTLWNGTWESLLDDVLKIPTPPRYFDSLPCAYNTKGRCAWLLFAGY